jgi:nicotinamidase-related amidase
MRYDDETGSEVALLLLDFQRTIVDNWAPRGEAAVGAARAAAAAARAAGVPVIHGQMAFRPGYPEVSGRNPLISPLAAGGLLTENVAGTEIVDGLVENDDVVVRRIRASPFHGTDLDVVLRARQITRLVIAGIATSGVVLSAVRAAGDLDYDLCVIGDACDDPDTDLHGVLLEKLFPRQARIVLSGDVSTEFGR